MEEHKPYDFSVLDPMRDPAAWQQILDEIVERACKARANLGIADVLMRWSKPVFGLCAGLALLVWAGEWFHSPRPQLALRSSFAAQTSQGEMQEGEVISSETIEMLEYLSTMGPIPRRAFYETK
jgi:hypothetical protein